MINPSDKVRRMLSIYSDLETVWAPHFARAIKNFEMVIGEQIDKKVRETLRKQNRPELIFNYLQGVIVALAGTIEQNHTYMKAVPITPGGEKGADMHTKLVSDWALPQCNGYKEIAKAQVDAAIAGIGWTNNYWGFKKSPLGNWITESNDPFRVMFDPMARKKDLTDCKYLTVSGWYTLDEILNVLGRTIDPELLVKLRDSDRSIMGDNPDPSKPKSWMTQIGDAAQQFFSDYNEREQAGRNVISNLLDTRTGRYRVIEFYDRRMKVERSKYDPMSRGAIPVPDKPEDEDQSVYDERIAKIPGTMIEISREEIWVSQCAPALYSDDVLMEKMLPIQDSCFPFIPIWCHDIHPDITKVANMITPLISPQDSVNQRLMTSLQLAMDAVAPPIKVQRGSIDPSDIEDWKSGDRRNRLLFYSGAQAPAEYTAPAQIAGVLQEIAQEHQTFLEHASPITPNVRGVQEGSGESGKLFAQRVRQGMLMLASFMGNSTLAMQQIFRYCDRNIQKFMTMPRAVRLLDEKNNPNWIQLNQETLAGVMNDVSQGEYDFVVDESQLGETAKQMQLATMMEVIHTVPPEYVKWSVVFKYIDFADSAEMSQYAEQVDQIKTGMAANNAALQQKMGELGVAGKTAQLAGQADQAATVQSQGAPGEPPPQGQAA